MALNWVMLSEVGGYVTLPSEIQLHQTPGRIAFSLQTNNNFPGAKPFLKNASAGKAYLSNQRLIYINEKDGAESDVKSFMCQLENVHEAQVISPFFGPNSFNAIIRPSPGGNIPATSSNISLKMTFNEGGAYDFLSIFERLREKRLQGIELARMNGSQTNSLFLDIVTEELPTYSQSYQSGSPTLIGSTDVSDDRTIPNSHDQSLPPQYSAP